MPSTTAQKLKIKEGDTLLTLHAPPAFARHLAPLPAAVKITSTGKSYNQVHWFVTSKEQVEKEVSTILKLVTAAVTCWIYFPKGSSGQQTNLTRDKGWDVLLAQGDALTWLSLVSFDDTWSAFAFRLSAGNDNKKKPLPAERAILQYVDAATKTIRLPEDLSSLFRKNSNAAAFFDTLSFSNRKEYVEWIVSAKQEATRKTRLDGTIERLRKEWKNPRNL